MLNATGIKEIVAKCEELNCSSFQFQIEMAKSYVSEIFFGILGLVIIAVLTYITLRYGFKSKKPIPNFSLTVLMIIMWIVVYLLFIMPLIGIYLGGL